MRTADRGRVASVEPSLELAGEAALPGHDFDGATRDRRFIASGGPTIGGKWSGLPRRGISPPRALSGPLSSPRTGPTDGQATARYWHPLERWQSGRMHRTRNAA
jgi:hypothetical protein